jgi:predicted fused transcriptional regulator/phosphomethylpyrimidine kinase
MKTLTVFLLLLSLAISAVAAETIAGKLVDAATANRVRGGSTITDTLLLTIEANGIRYTCVHNVRYASNLHAGRWIIGDSVTLTINGEKAKIRATDGFELDATIMKRERIVPKT